MWYVMGKQTVQAKKVSKYTAKHFFNFSMPVARQTRSNGQLKETITVILLHILSTSDNAFSVARAIWHKF